MVASAVQFVLVLVSRIPYSLVGFTSVHISPNHAYSIINHQKVLPVYKGTNSVPNVHAGRVVPVP